MTPRGIRRLGRKRVIVAEQEPVAPAVNEVHSGGIGELPGRYFGMVRGLARQRARFLRRTDSWSARYGRYASLVPPVDGQPLDTRCGDVDADHCRDPGPAAVSVPPPRVLPCA